VRLDDLCLMGSLAALAIPLSAGAVPAQSTGAVSLSRTIKQSSPLREARWPLRLVLTDITGNRTAMPIRQIYASSLRVLLANWRPATSRRGED
jgi:hypothetical protein